MSTEQEHDAALETLLAENERLRAVDERLQAETEHLIETQRGFEETRDQYIDLFEFVPTACLALDSDGAIEKLNGAAVLLLAHGRGNLVGAPLRTLLVPEDRRRLLDHLRACHGEQEQIACEVRLARPEGIAIPVRILTRRAHSGSGFLTAVIDLRERQASEAERQRLTAAERDARAVNIAKDQFIAMLSHELRTPLTPVLAAASALVDHQELSADMRGTLSIVQRNVARQAQLIDDLLDVARINHGKLRIEKQPVDVHRAIRDALETLAGEIDGGELTVAIDFTAQRAWVNGDSMRLQQVFWNLLRNAIKFTSAAGQIAVRSWNNAGRRVLVEISDNGRGIEPETLMRLFEPFEQVLEAGGSAQRGLGLGLPICRGIVQQHSGKIHASSDGLGKGARFVVELDTVDAPPARDSTRSSAPPTSAPGAKKRILLVEDHEDTAEIFEHLLRRDGYKVQVVHSVQAALAVDRGTFDVLVSDVGLGDGSGLDLMRTLRKERKLRGIALSGFGTEDDVKASKEAGFDAHVTKPVNFGDLLEAIATMHVD